MKIISIAISAFLALSIVGVTYAAGGGGGHGGPGMYNGQSGAGPEQRKTSRTEAEKGNAKGETAQDRERTETQQETREQKKDGSGDQSQTRTREQTGSE